MTNGCHSFGCREPIVAAVTVVLAELPKQDVHIDVCLKHLTYLQFDVKLRGDKPLGVGWGFGP